MKIKLVIAQFLIIGLFTLVGNAHAQTPQKIWAMELGHYRIFDGNSNGSPYQWREDIVGIDWVQGVMTYVIEGRRWDGFTWVLLERTWISISPSEMRFLQHTKYNNFDQLWYTLILDNPGVLWTKNPIFGGDSWPISALGTLNKGTVPQGNDVESITLTLTGTAFVRGLETTTITPFGTYNTYHFEHHLTGWDSVNNFRWGMTGRKWWVPYLGKIKWDNMSRNPFNGDGRLLTSLILPIVFSDIPLNFWAYHYTAGIFDDGITTGCGAMAYCPSNLVTRAEMASFLVRAIDGADATNCLGNVFNDVSPGAPHCANIERLKELNVTQGCGSGNYCPDNNVTRTEMASFLVRAMDKADAPGPCIGFFTDVPLGAPHCANIERLVGLGITQGCAAGMYCPGNNVLRDQMAAFLGRAFLGMP